MPIMSGEQKSPTVRRRRLAADLRRLREAAGLTHEDVAARLGWHRSKVGRIEGAQFVRLSLTDLRAMLDLYGVTDQAERDALARLAREAREHGWWHSYSDVLPNPHSTFIGLETEASTVRAYQAQLVPGLLQTEDYTRAVVKATRMTTRDTEEADRFVQVRQARQELLGRDPAVSLWAVLDEAVLRRQVGGPAVMRAQLTRLAEAAGLPQVTIQVLPFTAGEHAALEGSFTILGFAGHGEHAIVYLDATTGGIYVDKADDVARYAQVFDHARAAALSPKDSVQYITSTADTTS